jgi:hypothetical protein
MMSLYTPPVGAEFDFSRPIVVIDFGVCASSKNKRVGLINGEATTVVVEIAYVLVKPGAILEKDLHVECIAYDLSHEVDQGVRSYFEKFFKALGFGMAGKGEPLIQELEKLKKLVEDNKAQVVCTHMGMYYLLVRNALENSGIYPRTGYRPAVRPCWFYDDLSKDYGLPVEGITEKDLEDGVKADHAAHMARHTDGLEDRCCVWAVLRDAYVLQSRLLLPPVTAEAKEDER